MEVLGIHFRFNGAKNGDKRYRDSLDIIESILLKVGNGCRKTHIMYGANLSPVQLKRYLGILVKMDCIKYDGDSRLFGATQKGKDLLKAISEVTRAKAELQKHQKKVETFMEIEQTTEDTTLYEMTQKKT